MYDNKIANAILYGTMASILLLFVDGALVILVWLYVALYIAIMKRRANRSPEYYRNQVLNGDIVQTIADQNHIKLDQNSPKEPVKPYMFGLDEMGLTEEELKEQVKIELAARQALMNVPVKERKGYWKDVTLQRVLPLEHNHVYQDGNGVVHRAVKVSRQYYGSWEKEYKGDISYGRN